MKVILTGSSGFIGKEVLKQCLQHPAITSVVALSRRELPSHDKLQVTLVDDFLSYSDSARQAVKNADACIWTLGKVHVPNNEEARRIIVDYTIAGARLIQEECNKPFKFIYCSGSAAERDQTKSLWFLQEYRRIRGQVETELLEFSREHDRFQSYIMRPDMVISREKNLRTLVFILGPSIYTDVLANSMIKVALNGYEKDTLNCTELTQLASAGAN